MLYSYEDARYLIDYYLLKVHLKAIATDSKYLVKEMEMRPWDNGKFDVICKTDIIGSNVILRDIYFVAQELKLPLPKEILAERNTAQE